MAEEYSIVYMYHSFLIHSSADGHFKGEWEIYLPFPATTATATQN